MATIQQLPAHPTVSEEVLSSPHAQAPLLGLADPGTAIPLMGPAAPRATPLTGRVGPGTIAPLMGPPAPGTAIPLMGRAAPSGTPLMCPAP